METSIFLFFLSIFFLILTSLGILSLFKFTYLLEQIIFFLIISSANIILATFILSFLGSINQTGFLIVQTIFLFIVFLIAHLAKKRFLPLFARVDLNEFKDLKRHPHILTIGSGIFMFFIVSIFLILLVPPNNWDSMAYHLSRIGFWLQHSSMDFYETYDLRQNYLSPNAEILIMWPILFIKSDIFAGFVQWIGYLGTILLIYGIARELGANIFQGIFASLVWASIPEVMLEATSTQSDIIVTFFLIASIFFMLRGANEMGWKGFVASGISLGLAVGTKGTAILALPGIFIGALFLFYRIKNNFIRNLTIWGISACLGIIIFGSYIYIENYLHYGYPFSTKAGKADLTAPSVANMFYNLHHIGYRFLDNSGIPFINIPGFSQIRYFHEDYAGYGLVWLFLGVPAIFYALYKGFFKNDSLKAWIFIIAMGYLLSFSFALTINPHIFRLLIFFTAIICPLVAFFYPKEYDNKLNWRRVVFTLITVITVIPIFASTFANISKPLYLPLLSGKKSILEMSFYEKRFFFPSKMNDMIIFKELDRMSNVGSRVGIIASTDNWDYPAFGRRFDRIVIPILLKKLSVDTDIFTQYNLDYLIVFGLFQNVEGVKVNAMPFIEQLMRREGNSLNVLKAGNMFLFVRRDRI